MRQNLTITFHGGDMMREALMRNQGKILKALSKAVRLHTAKGTRLVGSEDGKWSVTHIEKFPLYERP